MKRGIEFSKLGDLVFASKRITERKAVIKGILGMISLVALLIIIGSYHGKQFRRKHSLTVGTVIKCDGGGKGNFGPGVYYQYFADGGWHNDSRRQKEFPYSIGKHITGKSFPVAYRKYWYGYESNLLISPTDFGLYGHPFPDSLNWILNYLKK